MTRAALAVAAISLLSTACGAAGNEPTLAEAAQKTEDTRSSRFVVTGTASELNEQIRIGCTGEADYEREGLRLSCDYGSSESVDVIALASTTYMRGDIAGFGDSEGKWVRLTDDESIARELSPHGLLAMLRNASRSTERIGNERVRDVDTVRYRLVVRCDPAELVNDCHGETAPVEVWIDDDGLVRRIAVEERSAVYAFEFFDFGSEVLIDAPPAGEVVEWAAPRACLPDSGSPLTGSDVRESLQRQGLDFEERDDCFAGQVAVFQTRDPGAGDGIVANCTVSSSALDSSTDYEVEGMRSAVVGNVQCVYADDLANVMTKVVADLERLARK